MPKANPHTQNIAFVNINYYLPFLTEWKQSMTTDAQSTKHSVFTNNYIHIES